MINQELKSFNKFYLFKLRVLALSCIFIFCFKGIASSPCEETFGNRTRTPAVTTPEKYSVRSSVWKLSTQGGRGTGFFIASNKLVTNFHVINGLLQHVSKVEDITLSQEGNARVLKIKGILAVSALHDLALLETTGSVDHYLPIRKKPLQEQEDLFLTGYPKGKLADIRKTSDRLMFSRDATSFFINNISLGGASGSPVVDAKKQVVGVYYSGDSNLVHSVNLNDLQVFVQRGLRNKPGNNPRRVVKREIQNLRNLAKRKNANAQVELGLMYYEGEVIPQSFEKAAELFKQAAEQGHATAQFNLAQSYYYGKGVAQNFEKSTHWYTKAAEQGNVQAQYNLGRRYAQGKGVTQNFEKSAHWYTKAAEQGQAEAQFNLAQSYYYGKGVAQNFEKSTHWYTKAAEQGNVQAQYMLGVMYYEGKGVAQNFEKAFEWYTKAAEQGHVEAQYNLAWSYYHGKGVAQNYEMAADWLKQAAMQSHPEAQYMLGVIYKEGEGVTKNFEMAAHWYTKAAEQSHPEAQYMLGLIYKEGKGVTKNFEIAAHWFKQAAEQGHTQAQTILETLLTNM